MADSQNARRAVIFDLYGTLVDLEVNEDTPLFWNALAADALISGRHITGESLKDIFMGWIQKISSHNSEGFMLEAVFSGMLEELGSIPSQDTVALFAEKFREHSIIHLEKKEYTDNLLHEIRTSGYKLGLVSNTEALLTAYDLRVLGLEDRFDATILSSNVGVKKPNKRIFETILDRLEVRPGDCAFVGDNFDDDIVGALNTGIATVFLTVPTSITPECGEEHNKKFICAGFNLKEIIQALIGIDFVFPSVNGMNGN